MTNQLMCFQCGKPFNPSFGFPVGKSHVCSNACAEAVLNQIDRDFHGVRTDEAVFQLIRKKAEARAAAGACAEPPGKYSWTYDPNEPWSNKVFDTREDALNNAIEVVSGISEDAPKSVFTGKIVPISPDSCVPEHVGRSVVGEVSTHLHEMYGEFAGEWFDMGVKDDVVDELAVSVRSVVADWIRSVFSLRALSVRDVKKHAIPVSSGNN